ncbi:MAG: hypothetical protein IT579_21035 [Verrucomicrobia subdivision 3 bacterium]|nr:hypothetical protein [Limisphaerales bacterium]
MNSLNRLCLALGLALVAHGVAAQAVIEPAATVAATNMVAGTNTFIGWSTNGAAIYQNFRVAREWRSPFPTNNPALATNPMIMRLRAANSVITNQVFAGFLPESLNQFVWTNFIAHTNGRGTQIWSQRTHPIGWPAVAPVILWNTNSLLWGMQGLTALSPCWEGEGSTGQVPVTLLTRRHGYTRGHGMGLEGFNTRQAGAKVWFLTADNSLVTATIRRAVVRTGKPGDYTILLFDRDLPDTIPPIRVATPAEVQSRYLSPAQGSGCSPIFKTEQAGNVSADVPGFTVNTWKGGDSGSPNLLPLPGELVFFSGRSTSGPSPEMQADMDALSELEGLNSGKYQLQWVDLSKYPNH